ncbi:MULTISPECIES: hypothetical protein [unclassified Lysobacter]|uniref:hypothetical protein n=1 Tax=unclassified Lysobacter TaxID=2635362 RepID=UPI001BE93C96|nr:MULTISPECIES: hypothetical protein [unclassified Lysobacter]MBT2748292.1 hypothetical protein [Lysobacter sp. ISL-42]MBT2749941.1 hypothetical protein [Lysobacter sp. ISL-50]MBT2781269.1 hypothetical protein [Lysobacter sp. ISL-52]
MHHKTQQLKDYLNGMKRNNRLALERLDTIKNWPELIHGEIERRAIHAIEILPDDMIMAIAKGEVNIQRVIREVLAD